MTRTKRGGINQMIALTDTVERALANVDDPEYPGVSIVALGLYEKLSVAFDEATGKPHITIALVPTFSGCPALTMIAADVIDAVEAATDAASVSVDWRTDIVWTADRMRPEAEQVLANEFTVVLRRADGTLRCPVCFADTVQDQSMAGPTRCRSVAWCPSCRNPVEVFRT